MHRLLDTIDSILSAFATRMLLSIAIIASLIPASMPLGWQIGFLVLFGLELLARTGLFVYRRRSGQHRPLDSLILLVDLLAVVSFVPGAAVGVLRWGRVARLLLLLTYWGPLAKDFVAAGLRQERLSQIMLVSALACALTGVGAAALRFVDTTGADIDGDGAADSARPGFADLLWWSYRQVQDPGNLIPTTSNVGLMVLSLALTLGGLMLIAVLIGIGASLVEDLARAGRQRKVGLRSHTVVLNVDEGSAGVLEQMRRYLSQQARWRKIALQGSTTERPDFLDRFEFRSFMYRAGKPASASALEMLDIAAARRVAVLASSPTAEADADAVTAVMSARMLNPEAWIVVELNRPANIPAALKAGRVHTVPVPARRLAALVLSQELMDPGRASLVKDFVALSGHEIYSALLGDGSLDDLPPTVTVGAPFGALRRWALREHRCLLLGYFAEEPERVGTPWLRGLHPVLNPVADSKPRIRGLIGLAAGYDSLASAARALAQDRGPTADVEEAPTALPVEAETLWVPETVIVLGFHEHTVETVGELLRIFPECEVTIVGKDEAERTEMRSTFLAEHTETGAHFEAPQKKVIQLCTADGTACGRVNIRVGDRYADGLFRPGDKSGPVGNLFDYDGAILLAEPEGSSDPDAATILGLLKLLDDWGDGEHRLKQIVGELADPTKAGLLKSRVADLRLQRRFSFVCTSELREQILSHSFFVPGLPPVLHNLITAGEEEIGALAPTTDEGTVVWETLVVNLGRRRPPIVPLAVEQEDGCLSINPEPDARFEWATIRTIYCLVTVPPTN